MGTGVIEGRIDCPDIDGCGGQRPDCSLIVGGPITCEEEELLLLFEWDAGTEYGAGPGNGMWTR